MCLHFRPPKVPGPPKWPKSWTLYCLYSLFWDIGPLFWALLEVQVGVVYILGSPGFDGGQPAQPEVINKNRSLSL